MAEIAEHCLFCHCRIASQSIPKHFQDCRADLIPLIAHFREYIYSMAKLGSGKGRFNFCNRECRDIRSYERGVLFQIAVMMGRTFMSDHFPMIPGMMKAL